MRYSRSRTGYATARNSRTRRASRHIALYVPPLERAIRKPHTNQIAPRIFHFARNADGHASSRAYSRAEKVARYVNFSARSRDWPIRREVSDGIEIRNHQRVPSEWVNRNQSWIIWGIGIRISHMTIVRAECSVCDWHLREFADTTAKAESRMPHFREGRCRARCIVEAAEP